MDYSGGKDSLPLILAFFSQNELELYPSAESKLVFRDQGDRQGDAGRCPEEAFQPSTSPKSNPFRNLNL